MLNKNWPEVVAINTYAGSLLQGARDIKVLIKISLEDGRYGTNIARWNFPDIEMRTSESRWPEDDLTDQVVIAHPPCAGFSGLTPRTSPEALGINSKNFEKTKNVMRYAMSHRAKAILIESVPGALEGGRIIHNKYAQRYNYRSFRILQNAVTFNLPQWRPRFWIIFLRAGKDFPRFIPIGHTPRVKAIGQLMAEDNPGEPSYFHVRKLEEQIKLLRDNGFSRRTVNEIFHGEHYGGFSNVLKKIENLREDLTYITARYSIFGKWISNMMRFLDPAGFTPVVIGTSCWYGDERLLGENEYKAVMGFPRDYYFPDNEKKKMLEYLSKGVCPPVLAWLLAWLLDLCIGKLHDPEDYDMFFALEDGDVADFGIKKEEALKRLG